jgi:hypothetical protein
MPTKAGDASHDFVVLTGMIVADPRHDRNLDGEAITALLVSFCTLDEENGWKSACCEVEVLDEIVAPDRKSLYAGARIVVGGEITGVGSVWAKRIVLGEAG